jgi:cardiolipin hydrolase
MNTHAIDVLLRETFEDLRLSRAEKRDLKTRFKDQGLDGEALAQVRARAFSIARTGLAEAGADSLMTLGWVEEVVKAVSALERPTTRVSGIADAVFSPGDGPRIRIQSLLDSARERVDICVFTITDDRVSKAIGRAHQRGVAVRVITDDDKSEDLGSDIVKLARLGVPVRRDKTDAHMHHKFALFDAKTLLNGSYNWTRAAARENEENVLITDDSRLVGAFLREFEALWTSLGSGG